MSTAPLPASAGPSRPIRPPVIQPRRAAGGTTQTIIVNPCQRGNPVLDAIKNVPWEYGQIVPDYQVGATTAVLFLSLRYHRLHPEYVHTRIGKLENRFQLRVLLMMCDVSEHEEPIRELTKVCLINNLTIMVAWTPEEAGLYLSTYKLFEHKPPDRIKERVDKDYSSLLRAALTSIRGVNKTDVTTLSSNVGSVREIADASVETLLACPGFGEVKSRRVSEAFQRPFRNAGKSAGARRGETPVLPPQTEEPALGRQGEGRKQRAPSPEWDDLDLDLADEGGEDAPPSAQAQPVSTSAKGRTAMAEDDVLGQELDPLESSDEDEPPAKRARTNGAEHTNGHEPRPRRESPEWDIDDLDLN